MFTQKPTRPYTIKKVPTKIVYLDEDGEREVYEDRDEIVYDDLPKVDLESYAKIRPSDPAGNDKEAVAAPSAAPSAGETTSTSK